MGGRPTRRIVMTHGAIAEAIDLMAREVRHRTRDDAPLAFVGIRRRGVPLAERLRRAAFGDDVDRHPLGQLDITLYRDDLSALGPQPVVGPTDLPFDIDGQTLILVDDVIFTGRTARAALDALVALGRPRSVLLAVLVDRGHREYPIQPDLVGQFIETTPGQHVEVMLAEIDRKERVVLVTPQAS